MKIIFSELVSIFLRILFITVCHRLDGFVICIDFSPNIDRCNVTAWF